MEPCIKTGTLFFFSICCLFNTRVYAISCANLLNPVKNPIQEILDKPLRLSNRQVEILKEHPIASLFEGNIGIRRIQLEPNLDPEEYHSDGDFSGEHLQAGFLRSLITEIGYDGKFMELHPRNFDVKHVLSFEVKDSADEYNPEGYVKPPISPEQRSRTVEMSDLKMANGMLDDRAPNDLRQKFKLPTNLKIGHLYFNIPNTNIVGPISNSSPDFFLSAQKLSTSGADIIIVSSISRFRDNPTEEVVEFLRKARAEYDQVLFLTEVRSGRATIGDGKVIVLNDTLNLMPDIHRASDLILIVGPINFFEALYSRVPTTVLLGDQTLGQYNRITADKLIANGEDFPNFKLIKSLTDKLLLQVTLAESYDYDAFTDFLDILYKKFENQLRRHGIEL